MEIRNNTQYLDAKATASMHILNRLSPALKIRDAIAWVRFSKLVPAHQILPAERWFYNGSLVLLSKLFYLYAIYDN